MIYIMKIRSVCLCHGQHAIGDCRYFLAPCDKRKHTGHAQQQPPARPAQIPLGDTVWLSHSSLGFQRPVGRYMHCAALLRLTPQATIAQSVIVTCIDRYYHILEKQIAQIARIIKTVRNVQPVLIQNVLIRRTVSY